MRTSFRIKHSSKTESERNEWITLEKRNVLLHNCEVQMELFKNAYKYFKKIKIINFVAFYDSSGIQFTEIHIKPF